MLLWCWCQWLSLSLPLSFQDTCIHTEHIQKCLQGREVCLSPTHDSMHPQHVCRDIINAQNTEGDRKHSWHRPIKRCNSTFEHGLSWGLLKHGVEQLWHSVHVTHQSINIWAWIQHVLFFKWICLVFASGGGSWNNIFWGWSLQPNTFQFVCVWHEKVWPPLT